MGQHADNGPAVYIDKKENVDHKPEIASQGLRATPVSLCDGPRSSVFSGRRS